MKEEAGAVFIITQPSVLRLMVPGSRTEPFFPLRSCRSTGTIHPQNAAPVPPSGIAAFASNGIIPGRLPRSDKPSPASFFDNFPVVLFVELHIYNTVVLREKFFWAGTPSTPSTVSRIVNSPARV